MKLSAQMTLVVAVIFAVICFGAAITGFSALAGLTDVKQLADSRGYAWFWTFLGVVATVFAAISWWMIRTDKGQ